MDMKEDDNAKKDTAISLDENLNRSVTTDGIPGRFASDVNRPQLSNSSHLPLSDINNKNPREYLNSIEKAQKKWIENAKSWPVTDETQNAQLQWIKEFSTGAKFLCTSTPQTKKKETPRYNLPWSPPKSSADVDPRRGVCVYKPGMKNTDGSETKDYINEKGCTVKVARLEEPAKVPSANKVLEDCPQKQEVPHDDGSRNDQKSPKRRYITVRKKLDRLKKLESGGTEEKDQQEKKSTTLDGQSEEKREAARQYILKKRMERERELEIQRRKEMKAEAEKKARMERLRETQQRLIKNALKRQSQKTPDKRSVSRERVDSEEDCYPLWNTSSGNNLPEPRMSGRRSSKLSPRTKQRSSEDVTGGLENAGGDVVYQSKQSLGSSNERTLSMDQNLVDFVMDQNVPSQKKLALIELLEERDSTGRSVPQERLSDILKSKEYLDLIDKFSDTSPRPSLVSPKMSLVTPNPLLLSPNPSSVSPKPKSPSNPPVISSMGFSKSEEKINRLSAENIPNIVPSTSKKILGEDKKSCGYYRFEFAETSPTLQDLQRSYNILRAVKNKRAAIEHYNRESTKKNEANMFLRKERPDSTDSLNKRIAKDIEDHKLQESKSKRLSEKGVQCYVEEERFPLKRSSSKNAGSYSLGSSDLPYSQNELLRKPNLMLFPGMTSELEANRSKRLSLPEKEPILSEISHDKFLVANIELSSTVSTKDEICIENYLKDEIPLNAKGRPSIEPSFNYDFTVDSLNVPSDLTLVSRTSDVSLVHCNDDTKARNSDNLDNKPSPNTPVVANLNVASSLNLNSKFIETSGKEEEKKMLTEPASHLVIEESARETEWSQSNRDSRIEEEIRKLDSFNDSITSVIEKNKLAQNESILKSSCDESLLLEKTRRVSTATNDVPLERPQSTTLRGSHSSSSLDLQSEDISSASVARFSLNLFSELLKDEDMRSQHQAALFKMNESSITEKTKAEIAFLELEKKKMKEVGNEEGVRNIRKKIRGLIIKLEHDLEELHRLRRAERNEYRKRRQRLVDKINLIRMQLRTQADVQKVNKEGLKMSSNPVIEMKKSHITDRRGPDMRLHYEKKKKELELRESVLAERLAELENISSWKQRLEEGEKRIQELEARLKLAPVPDRPKDGSREGLVERGTSPFRLTSDESQGERERQKAEGSYSDTFDQASSSSTHDRLEGKDARKMMAIKIPLSPRVTLKRRHSSGSDESLLLSQTETQSEASDMEVRVLALQTQLKQRKAKLESLHREYKKSQRERLIAKEQSLLSQIQAYDLYIEQVKKELEKEKEGSSVKIVRPLIKQPKLLSDRRKSDTWIIQENKDKNDLVKDTQQSAFVLSSSANVVSNVLKKKISSESKRTNVSLDTKNEALSLKSKLTLKNSFSDPNLVGSEQNLHSRVSHSSTESCESDIEKTKVSHSEGVQIRTRHNSESSIEKELQALIDNQFEQLLPDKSNYRNDGSVNKKQHNEGTDSISEKPKTISSEKNAEKAENEENSSTQDSIISKMEDNLRTFKEEALNNVKKVVSEISPKNEVDDGSNDDINSEVMDESVKVGVSSYSSVKTEHGVVINDDTVVDSKVSDPSQKSNKSSTLENETEKGSTSGSIVEIISENATSEKVVLSKVESVIEDLLESQITPDQSIIKSIKDVSLVVRSTTSEINEVVSEDINTDIGAAKDSSFADATNDISEQLSPVDDSEEKETMIEESVKEVTYLEVSDHIMYYEQDSKRESLREEDASGYSDEKSLKNESDDTKMSAEEHLSIIEDIENYLRKEESVTIETVQTSPSDVQDEEKSTFHSASEVEEIVSKSNLEDFSDGSFPLPITGKSHHQIIDKSETSEQIISEVVASPEELISEKSRKTSDDIGSRTVMTEELKNTEDGSRDPSILSEIESVASEISKVDVPEELSQKSSAGKSESNVEESSSSTLKNDESVHTEVPTHIRDSSSELKSDYSSKKEDALLTVDGDEVSEVIEDEKSFSDSFKDSDLKSPLDESNLEDSLDDTSAALDNLKVLKKTGDGEEEFESVSEGSDSCHEGRLSEDDYNLLQEPLLQPQQLIWAQETDLRIPAAPLIDALQREGVSALDLVWRGIAESALEEATDLVISTYIKRSRQDSFKAELNNKTKQVGDNDEDEWGREKLPPDQAAEAEVLRLQQLRIDKETRGPVSSGELTYDDQIEELEEEEARRYCYLRAIPDKPPPPYTPRRSSLVSNVVEAAGEIWSGQRTISPTFMPGSHLRDFIWDLASELVLRVNPPPPPPQPAWIKNKRARPKKPIRTREELVEEVEKEAKIYLGVEEREVRENLIIRWSRKRRDHVDEILVRESQEEEWEWTDFTEEENIIKNRIAEALIHESLVTATVAIAQAFSNKFKQ